MTIQEQAQKYINQFEIIKIQDTDKTRVILKDNTDTKLHDAVGKAHGDRFPNDFVFSTFLSILEKITEYDMSDTEAMEDNHHEIIDSLVDVYTHDLTEWLASDINNVNYLTDALESGIEMREGFQLLSLAQYVAIDEVYPFVSELFV